MDRGRRGLEKLFCHSTSREEEAETEIERKTLGNGLEKNEIEVRSEIAAFLFCVYLFLYFGRYFCFFAHVPHLHGYGTS